MFNTEVNHHQIVQDAISGRRPADEQALSCLAVLEDRLEGLKKLGPQFAGVGFSSAAQQLTKRHSAITASL
jgi:hypothetical protein